MSVTNGVPRDQDGTTPSIHLYTNHGCPYAHRAHIALKELGLPYEETIIDLDTPREPWYLKINPRGLVPSIKFSNGRIQDEILIESGIIVQFLADIRPSHLLPKSLESPTAPLFRAKVNFFVDTFNTKIASFQMSTMKLDSLAEKETKCKEWAQAIEKEIEPLLANANPYLEHSSKLTLAEVYAAPFVIRWYTLSDGSILPTSFKGRLNELPNFSRWASHVMNEESVTYIWNAEKFRQRAARMIAVAKQKAETK